MNIETLVRRLAQLTVPSTDDGAQFVRTDRLEQIRGDLDASAYRCLGDVPLAAIYFHRDYQPSRPTILISNHIDSVYGDYFCDAGETTIRGTFDNSACNAVAVELMLAELLPPQTLIAFTGDEEADSGGVDQTVYFLQDHPPVYENLEAVVALDLTEEAYERHHFTIENYFIERQNRDSLLQFARKRDFKRYLVDRLGNEPHFIKNAEPDESWQYDEHDLNCFTFCLPCRVLGSDMHDNDGVAIRRDSLIAYAKTFAQLAQAIDRDLAKREMRRHVGEQT